MRKVPPPRFDQLFDRRYFALNRFQRRYVYMLYCIYILPTLLIWLLIYEIVEWIEERASGNMSP